MKYLRKLKKFYLIVITLFKLDYDNYVPYFWKKFSLFDILKLERLRFIRQARIKYWHKKASRYGPFKPFFNEDKLRDVQENKLLNTHVRSIYKFGSTIITDVLSKNDIKSLNKFVDSLKLKSGNSFIQVNLPTNLKEIRNSLLKKLYPVYEHFMPKAIDEKNFSNIYVGMRIDYSFDGVDLSPATANWHVDRFLPTINAIYFPNGANWGEFEKDFGNPLITDEDIKYYIKDKRKKKKNPRRN